MPLSVDIFNKKILSSQSRFGKYDILLSGEAGGSEFTVRPTVNGTGVLLSGEAAGLPETIVYTTGDQTISGNKIFANDITVQGAILVNQVIDITTTGTISGVTGEFKYLRAEGGMISGDNFDFYADDIVFSGVNLYVVDSTGIFTNKPLVNGTGVLLEGEAYPSNNPSGFITGVDLTPYATVSNLTLTGSTLDTKIDNLSGVSILNYGGQTVSGLKDFAIRPTVNTVPVALSGEAASNIEQFVKNDYGFTLYKGQPVYVSGSNGNNILIHPASNTGEGTSSKTFGLLKQTLLNNEQGYVVTEGALLNVDTSMATEGDPVWLGPTGNIIYGLANKPKAPQHLVSLGFVERAHQNQGKIFVKVQNGFELDELHDVRIVNKQNSDIIIYNSGSGLWFNSGVNFENFYTNNNPSGYINNTNLQNLRISLQTGIESYTGAFDTIFSSTPAVVANLQTTGDYGYTTSLTQITTSGFAIDFSDIILESGVILNIIAYDGQFN